MLLFIDETKSKKKKLFYEDTLREQMKCAWKPGEAH